MKMNRFANLNDPLIRNAVIQAYAKSFRIKGVKRMGVLPAHLIQSSNLTFLVELQNPSASPNRLIEIGGLLEWLLHRSVSVVTPHVVGYGRLDQMEEITL